MQTPAVSSAELTLQSAALPTRSPRPSWQQRVWSFLLRGFETCSDVPTETFATEDYLLLSGRARRYGRGGLSDPFL